MVGSPKRRAKRQAEEAAKKAREDGTIDNLPAIAKARAIVARGQSYRGAERLQITYLPDSTLDEELRKLGADGLPVQDPIDAEFEPVPEEERIADGPPKRDGRGQKPKVLSEEQRTQILDLTEQNVSIRAIRQQIGISRRAFQNLFDNDPDFKQSWLDAKQSAADFAASEMIALADSSLGMDAAGVQSVKLMVDTRKWIAAKLKPKVYGEQVNMRLEAVVHEISDSDLDARIASLLAPIKARQAEEEDESDPV